MPIFGSQSSINAGGYGFLGAKERTIQSTIAPKNLVEGTQITVSVTTDGYSDGTVLYYTVRGNLGTITAADFTDNSLTGTFTINNDSGSFTKTVAADGVIEGGEGFVIDIRAVSHTSAVIETTQSVYIQGSQSTGVGNVDDGQGGSTFHDFGSDGNLVFDANTSTSYTYTAATDVKFNAFLWGQGGTLRGGTGGYSYGTFDLSQGDAIYIRLNYGGGVHGNEGGSGNGASGDGGGLAGIFSSSTINQSNARLIAGGGGGGANPVGGSGSVNGGAGGGPSGSSGDNSPDTQRGSTGGGGASQSGGGGGGGHGGSPGSALAGGTGGNGTGSHPNYAGGGGGGGGYYGGGGGGGGNDDGSGSRSASGGGGGSGYVHSSVINGFTGGFSSGQSNPNRGNAGESGQNSKIVFAGIFAFEYRGSSSNDSYSVNIPAVSTSMTAKVWGAGGAGNGECPTSGTGLNPGNFSGGSGGHVEGTIPVTGGSTVTVYVGGSGAGSGSPSMAGSGAGDGGGLSAVKYGSNILVAGGGGGAGQASNGGYGGGNGSGHPGTGGNGAPRSGGGASQSGGGSGGSYDSGVDSTSPGSSWNNGSNVRNGGDSGGSGGYQGKRGGGGGSGYYGGGGGGGDNGDCSGGGGGGGSGIINGSWTNTVSQNGQNGQAGGRGAVDTGDEHYVSGFGGSSQNGLVVLIFS